MSKTASTNGVFLLFVRKRLLRPERYWYAVGRLLLCDDDLLTAIEEPSLCNSYLQLRTHCRL
eukprot:5436647-Amphidinium_carterae.1